MPSKISREFELPEKQSGVPNSVFILYEAWPKYPLCVMLCSKYKHKSLYVNINNRKLYMSNLSSAT